MENTGKGRFLGVVCVYHYISVSLKHYIVYWSKYHLCKRQLTLFVEQKSHRK